MKQYFILITFLVISLVTSAQKHTISGTISSAENGETLIGASIRVKDLANEGAITNEYGFYSITLPTGKHSLISQYIGFSPDTLTIILNKNIQKNFSLKSETEVLSEVIISETKSNNNVTSAQTGLQKLEMKEMNSIPVLFGERDIIKSLQLLPGVKSSGDGGGGIFVRGGTGDQNLILLDEAIVYNASHLMGFFSTFNSDAIKNVDLYKGTQPAQYGGRLSSAMDIRMKDGNNQKYEANGSIGLISSKLSLEGPIKKDKGSILISGRRTYADLFLKLDNRYKDTKLYFYDLNMKANYKFGHKDVIYLSGYFGRDNLGLKNLFGMDWGNATGTLRWNHLFSNKLFANTTLIYSNFDYKIDISSSGQEFAILSNIQDYNLKHEYQYYINNKNTLKIGLSSIYHNILPGEVTIDDVTSQKLQEQNSLENAIYLSEDWKLATWFNINAGLRFSSFSVLGGGDFYDLNAQHEVIDTVNYKKSDIITTYYNPEPRINASFLLSDKNSIKAAYSRNTQYLHLISNSTTASPTDKWMGSDNNIKPEIADLYSIGYFQNFKKDEYESSIELYYKEMQNQIDYKDGADIMFNNQIATQLLTGIGRAYGLEFFFKKKTGKITGWISYTLSRTEKKIDGINNYQWYAARQDKTHDISIVASYQATKRLNISANWVYSTGNAVTFPSGKYFIDDQIIWLYTERNGYRMPAYHRLDIGATLKLKENRHFSSEISVGIYNAYGRENAYLINFRENESDPTKTEAVQTALFKFVPSISWNFRLK